MQPFRRLLSALAALILAACCGITGPESEQFTLYVAPHTVECTGEGVQQCLLVRRSVAAEWTNFYDAIEGFTYEPGFDWTLRVSSREVRNPPADGSSIAYRLITVLEKTPAQQAAP